MRQQVEAVYEDGVLRPLEPLSLAEKQRVRVTITDAPVVTEVKEYNHRQAEMEWIGAHARDYIGQWLALEGSELLSHGFDRHAVKAEARRKGAQRPLLFQVPEDFGQPSAGWL